MSQSIPATSPRGLEEFNEESKATSDPSPSLPTRRWALTLLGLYLGAVLYGLDTTIAADVQTAVYERFDNIELLPWVGIGFPMAAVSVILLWGRLYSILDIKTLFLIAITLFEAGSALCGAAPSMNALIIGRVIAGIGGSGMYLGALTYMSVFGQGPRLPLYNASVGLMWGLGAILGPVIGGAFSVSSATWRWAFYINLPLAALCSPIYVLATPSWTAPSKLTTKEKLFGLDWVGVFLNAAVFVFAMTALTFSGSLYSWGSATSIGLWVSTGIVSLAFAVQQHFAIFTTTTERIFPGHFLKSRDMVLLAIATACAATANATTLYYIPLFFSFTHGDTALEAAVRLLPFIVIFIVFVMLAGGALPAIGRYAPLYLVGGILTTIGTALMFTIRSDTSIAKIYGYEILIAAGAGLGIQNGYAVASAKVASHDRPNAIGFMNTAQIGFLALALSIAGCLYQNLGYDFLSDALREYHLSDATIRAMLGGLNSAAVADAPQALIDRTVETVAFTISRLFGLPLAASALSIVVSLLMKQEKLDLSVVAGG